jgi:AbrB family looped-hinge helix DNA binding protein
LDMITVDGNGRITIPASLRKKYGISHGTKVRWLETRAGLVMIMETRGNVKLRGLWTGLKVDDSDVDAAKKSLFKHESA